jgi:hypothetical protein
MKTSTIKTTFLSSLILLSSAFARTEVAHAQSSDDLEEFQRNFDNILKSHDDMIAQVIFFSDHIGDLDKNVSKIQTKKKRLESYIDGELSRLKNINNVKDNQFLDSVSYYYTCIRKTIEKEYDEAISLRVGMKFTHPHVSAFVNALEEADNDIIQIEKALYGIEKQYAQAHKMKFPQEMEDLKSSILKNEAVLKYHDKLLLTFYAIYEKENDVLKNSKNTSDSVLHAQRIAFADLMLASEDTIYKYRVYESDQSFTLAIKQYFKYVRGQYFENFEFYNEYVRGLQNKQIDPMHQYVASEADKSKYAKEIRAAQAQLKGNPKSKSEGRGEILEEIEEASFRFLYNHSPRFKR